MWHENIDAFPLLNFRILLDTCAEVSIPKGQMIFCEGQIAKYAYFIVSGKAWSYCTDETGRTIAWSLYFNEPQSVFSNLFIADYKSFLTQTPGTMSIEAITDLRALRIARRGFEPSFGNDPGWESCLRKLNEYSFIMAYERVLTLLTLSATERYNRLLRKESYLLQIFNDKYLASYIGVEPQSLSRIRRNIKCRSLT